MFVCLALSGSEADKTVDFTLYINTSQSTDSKVTLISEDEVDFITRTLTNEMTETSLQVRPKVKYSLMVRTEGFVPRMEEFIITSETSVQNFVHLDIHHLKDDSGKVVGEQIVIIFPNEGVYSEHELGSYTTDIIKRLAQVKSVSSLTSYSETKFYMTASDYRMKLQEEGKVLAQFDENSVVKYLIDDSKETMANDSYDELIPTDLSRLMAIGSDLKVAPKVIETNTLKQESNTTSIVTEQKRTSDISEEKLFFTVQLGSFSKQVKSPKKAFNTSSVFTQANEAGGFKYYSGVFYTYSEADAHKESLMVQGAEGLFVAAFNKGERITLKDAISAAKEAAETE